MSVEREEHWDEILDPLPEDVRDGAKRFMRALVADYPEMGEKVITEVVLRNLVNSLDDPIWVFADESYEVGFENAMREASGERDDDDEEDDEAESSSPLDSEEFWDE